MFDHHRYFLILICSLIVILIMFTVYSVEKIKLVGLGQHLIY